MKKRMIFALLMVTATGCGGVYRRVADTASIDGARVIPVPYVAQSGQRGCGSAALEMVLTYWGEPGPVLPEWAKNDTISIGNLKTAAEERGMSARVVKGTDRQSVEDLLSRGIPLLVLDTQQPREPGGEPVRHLQVLIGTDVKKDRFILLDPAWGGLTIDRERFWADWEAQERFLFIVGREGLPVSQVAGETDPSLLELRVGQEWIDNESETFPSKFDEFVAVVVVVAVLVGLVILNVILISGSF